MSTKSPIPAALTGLLANMEHGPDLRPSDVRAEDVFRAAGREGRVTRATRAGIEYESMSGKAGRIAPHRLVGGVVVRGDVAHVVSRAARRGRGGEIPLSVLERRLSRLSAVVRARNGKVDCSAPASMGRQADLFDKSTPADRALNPKGPPPGTPEYSVGDARYAKGQKAVRVESTDSGMKNRAERLLGALRVRHSGRERAYIIPPSKLRKFEKLYADGWDANFFSNDLIPPPGVDASSAPVVRSAPRRRSSAPPTAAAAPVPAPSPAPSKAPDTSYVAVRADAQRKANEMGHDFGIERNSLYGGYRSFMLPRRENRTGHELRCEVVQPESMAKTQPGHGSVPSPPPAPPKARPPIAPLPAGLKTHYPPKAPAPTMRPAPGKKTFDRFDIMRRDNEWMMSSFPIGTRVVVDAGYYKGTRGVVEKHYRQQSPHEDRPAVLIRKADGKAEVADPQMLAIEDET